MRMLRHHGCSSIWLALCERDQQLELRQQLKFAVIVDQPAA